MAQYKTVAGPVALSIEHDGDYGVAVAQYGEIISQEAAGGWKLHCIQPITVTKHARSLGCLASILVSLKLVAAPTSEEVTFNMMVFVKES